MSPSHASQETRTRLLEAATEAFAVDGFRNARVRDICNRAQANLAAINYHFGDKSGLYGEVLQRAFRGLAGDDATDMGVDRDAAAEVRLHEFVRSLLMQLLTEGRGAMQAKLVAREMVDPTDAITRVIEDGIRPQVEILLELVRDRLGERADDQLARRCASSILGQCLFYYFARSAIVQLPLEEHLPAENIEPIAAHITAFSMGALERLAPQVREPGSASSSARSTQR